MVRGTLNQTGARKCSNNIIRLGRRPCNAENFVREVRMEQGLEERTSPEASYGTKLHAIMEEYVKVVHVGSNETTPENRDDIIEALCEKHGVEFTVRSCTEIVNMCEKINGIITRFQPNVILTEQFLEFCLYGEVMFYGTADLVLYKDDGDYYVIDYKTGQNKVETFNNIQLQAYAACLFQKKGNRYIIDMSAAMDLADIPITDFMKSCDVSVDALQDAVCMHLKETGKCKTIKEAKQEFAERLESVIAFKEPVEFISK